jgi:hypothetical protein
MGLMYKFRTLVFFLIIYPSIIGVAGSSLPGFRKFHMTYGIRYQFEGTSKTNNSNEILRDLANAAVKNVQSIRLDLDLDLEAEIDAAFQSNCKLKLRFLPLLFQGDHYFRGFDITDVLVPDKADIEFVLGGRSDTSGYSVITGENLPVSLADSLFQEISIPCPQSAQDSISVSSVFLFYDENGLDRFHERLSLINDYFAADALTDSLLAMAASIDLRHEEQYSLYFVYLAEITKAVEIIGRKNLVYELNLPSYDPKNFAAKYRELFRQSKSLTMTYNEHIENAKRIYPAVTGDSVISVFLSGIERYIDWSMLVSERNGRIYSEYLDDYYSVPAFGNDILMLKKLLGKISPGANEDTLVSKFFQEIRKGYRTTSKILTEENHYAEALELMEHERRFSAFNPYTVKELNDDSVSVMAASGIYNSYLTVAESSIRYGRFDMAERYLIKAKDFRRMNFPSRLPDSLFRKVMLELVREQIARCDALAAAKEFRESLDCFRYLEAVHDSASIAVILPDLKRKKDQVYSGLVNELLVNAEKFRASGNSDSAMALFDMAGRTLQKMENATGLRVRIDSLMIPYDLLRYEDWLTRAGNHYQRKEFIPAYAALVNATALSQKYHYSKDTVFDSLRKMVFPRYMQQFIMMSERLIWQNRLREATVFIDSISRILSLIGYQDDPGLTRSIEKFRTRIREKECLNIREAMEIYALRAQHHIEKKNYMYAKILLDSAMQAGAGAGRCPVPVDVIGDTLEKYRPAFVFQESMSDFNNLVSIGNFDEAIRKYLETQSFYSVKRIERFGLVCDSLYEVIHKRSNLRLTLGTAEFFRKEKDYPVSFRYLKLYRLQGGQAKDVKDQQKLLGNELAGLDFIKNPDYDPMKMVTAYSGHDKWMASFDRAYVFQWNVLKNAARKRSGKEE